MQQPMIVASKEAYIMIDARWLFLIVPVSMVVGALVLVCLACIIVGKETEAEIDKACEEMQNHEEGGTT